MYGENKRLHTSYISDGAFSSLSSSSREAMKYQHHEMSKSSLYASNDGTSNATSNCNTLAERKNGVNRMLDLVDPASLNLPLSDDLKTSNLDPSLNGLRRRSHRPRGCRGGRKNRKSQQAKAQALIPKIILDDVTASPRHSISMHSQENAQKYGKPVIGQWNINAERPASVGTIACAGGLPFMSQSYGVAAAFSSSSLGHNGIVERSEQTPSPPPPPPVDILPPSNFTHVSKESFEHSQQTHMAAGLNPYSLNFPIHAPMNNNDICLDLHKPSPCGSMTLNATLPHSMGSKLPPKAPPLKGCNPASLLDDYRKLRIQKQRQMNGGSLFATSPRSFLLGMPNGPSYTAW